MRKIPSIEHKNAERRPSEEVKNDNPEFKNVTFDIITYSSNDEGFAAMKLLKTIQTIPQNVCTVAQFT